MLAAVVEAIAVANPIEQGRADSEGDQCADLDCSHVVCSWCIAGGGSAGLVDVVGRFVVGPGQFFVRLVRANVDQCGDMADVGEFGRFAAVVQCGDGQLNPAANDFCDKGLLVEVTEVLLAQLGEGYQHVAEVAVQQLDGGRVRCWH